MHDVFISYKREERETAQRLAHALRSRGWSVWWDVELLAGDHFDDRIEAAIREAKSVIVLWSRRSARSRYVKDEASLALKLNKLVPVATDDLAESDLPMKFQGLHTISLCGWQGSVECPPFHDLEKSMKVHGGARVRGSHDIHPALLPATAGNDLTQRSNQSRDDAVPLTAADLRINPTVLLKVHNAVRTWVAGPHCNRASRTTDVDATAPHCSWERLAVGELLDFAEFLEQPGTPRSSVYGVGGSTAITLDLVRQLVHALESKGARSILCLPDQLQRLPVNLKRRAVKILLNERPSWLTGPDHLVSGQSLFCLPFFVAGQEVPELTQRRLEEYRIARAIGDEEAFEIDQIADLLNLRKG